MEHQNQEEEARRELLSLMEEMAGRYWGGQWFGTTMHYLLWRMVHGGSTDGWPVESIPSVEHLQRLRELSQQAGGWWCIRRDPESQAGRLEFVSLSIWRRHYLFLVIALPLASYLAWGFIILASVFCATLVPFLNPTWNPSVSWLVGVLVGLMVLVCSIIGYHNWALMFLGLLKPIDWLLTGRRLW